MRSLSFIKMQGLGNDFVVVEGPLQLSAAEIGELCDRRRGIGADGVLIVTRGDPIRMEYWNADGSPAEMCGNGLRCVARYAYDRGWAEDRDFGVQTAAGLRGVRVHGDWVEVDLGRAGVTGEAVIDGDSYVLVGVGNPHAVMVVDDPESVDVARIGGRVASDPQFPDGTNVEFMAIEGGRVSMRVWERGVGETLACGTGMAAAALVASNAYGLAGPISVEAPGGTGEVEFRDGVAWLRGPAEYVFRGSVGER